MEWYELQKLYEAVITSTDEERRDKRRRLREAEQSVFATAPITEVTLYLNHSDKLEPHFKLEGDCLVYLGVTPRICENRIGGFVEMSEVISKTVSECWIRAKQPNIEYIPMYENGPYRFEDHVLVATRNEHGIILDDKYFGSEGLSDRQLRLLDYIHPKAHDVVVGLCEGSLFIATTSAFIPEGFALKRSMLERARK